MNIFTFLSFMATGFYVCLGVFAWRKEPRSRLARIFFLQCLGLAVWAGCYAFVYQAADKEILWLWFKLSSLGWCTFAGITLHFVLLLCGKEKTLKRGWVYILLYLPGLILVYQVWTGFVTVKDFILGPLGWIEVPSPDSFWYWFHIANLLVCVFVGLYLIRQRGKAVTSAREKAQTRRVLVTAASVLVLGFTINMILPVFDIKVLPAIAPLILVLWAKGVWESMVQYRLKLPSPKVAGEEIMARMKDILMIINTSGEILQMNPQARVLLGYNKDELLGKPVTTVIEDREIIAALAGFTKNDAFTFTDKESTVITREGGTVPVLISLSVIWDDFKDPIGIVLVGHDLRQTNALQQEISFREIAERKLIKARDLLEWQVKERTKELEQANKKLEKEVVERKLSEEALRQSKERYRTILESIEDGYFEVDLNGNVLFCNEAEARMFGYTPEELIGMNYREYTDPENTQKVFETFNLVYSSGFPERSFSWVLTKPDGSKVHVETSVSLMLDSTGQKLGFRGILRDVTKQKQAEEVLKTMSLLDDLTGLYNRRGFLTLAAQELKVAHRMKHGICLLFADLDDLKVINDNLGHREGDRALIEIARIIKENFRDPDIIARIGGDEFVVLAIEGVSEAGPELLAERLRNNLQLFNEGSGRPYNLSLSLGIAGYDPEHPVSIDTLLSQADKNMYEEKQGKKKNTQLRLEF